MNCAQNLSKYLRFCTVTSRVGAFLSCWVSVAVGHQWACMQVASGRAFWLMKRKQKRESVPRSGASPEITPHQQAHDHRYPILNSTHHASAMQAHQSCLRGMHTGHALRDNGAGSLSRVGTATLRPYPRSDAPVWWSWRRMLERTRLIWQRK